MTSKIVCVDTSFIIAIERQDRGALKLQELADRGEVIYTTAVSVAECYRGAYGSKDRIEALREVKELLDMFAILSLDHDSGRTWGELAESTKSYSIGDARARPFGLEMRSTLRESRVLYLKISPDHTHTGVLFGFGLHGVDGGGSKALGLIGERIMKSIRDQLPRRGIEVNTVDSYQGAPACMCAGS